MLQLQVDIHVIYLSVSHFHRLALSTWWNISLLSTIIGGRPEVEGGVEPHPEEEGAELLAELVVVCAVAELVGVAHEGVAHGRGERRARRHRTEGGR